MIKTATPSVTQDAAKEAEYTSESSGTMKQASAPSRVQSAETKVTQVTTKESRVQFKQSSADASEAMNAEIIQEELKEINLRLKAWQDRVDELLNDPNNADKIVNLLNSIQYMVNRRAELNIIQRQYMSSTNGYAFQDNQSILHAGSVRRKDTEALKIIERENQNR